MTGRISKEARKEAQASARAARAPRVSEPSVEGCPHALGTIDSGDHDKCFCCKRPTLSYETSVYPIPGTPFFTSRGACPDCFERGADIPKPISFRHDVVTGEVGTCMFCSDPSATMVFIDTGESICERCVG